MRSSKQWFVSFQLTYNKKYSSADEKTKFSEFQRNLRAIATHNSGYKNGTESYFLRITEFADLTDDEFEDIYLNYGDPDTREPNYFDINVKDIPKTIDWRNRGAVLRVKHQGKCKSSYAFSTVCIFFSSNNCYSFHLCFWINKI